MTRSTARWTTALAAAALIGLPAAGRAQETSPAPQTPQTQSAQNPASATAASPDQNAANSPADHVRLAKQALDSIPRTSIPAASRAKFAQLRTHVDNLERAVASGAASPSGEAGAAGTAGKARTPKAASAANWGTEAAAIDKILTDLIGPEGSPSAAPADPTGTSGGAHATPGLDESMKDKLREVRRHITELASSMSGTASAAGASAAPSAPPSTPPSTPPTTEAPPTPPASPQPTPAAQPGATPQSTTPPAATAAQPGATAAKGQADQTAARQYLSAARDALSQVTQMPEASKLQGEARTQVSQLISNFNELITTQTDWHAAYAKVEANLNALLGPAGTDESAAPTPTQSSAPGAVGTSGTTNMQIDPAIRAKLQEVRRKLQQFQQVAAGTSAGAGAPETTMTPNAANTTNPPATGNPPSTAPSNPTSAANPSAASSATGYSTAPATPATAGSAETTAAQSSEAQRHLDAIADIVNRALGTSGATSTPSTAGAPANPATPATSGDVKIDRAQLEQIRMHVEQLRQLVKAGK